MSVARFVPWLALAGCIRTIGPGPDVGACADYPEGTYTYGEIGIGSCLAGPVDMAFFADGDRTLLAVANADPYMTFTGGNVAFLDLSALDFAAGRNTIDKLAVGAVNTQPMVGGLGVVPSRGLLLASDRYSGDVLTTSFRDDLNVFDIHDPAAPTPWSEGDTLTVEDDPQQIVVDGDRAYVVNLTDHSISVVDTSSTPLELLDVAPDASISPSTLTTVEDPAFGGAPGGSTGSVASSTIDDPKLLLSEQWTMTWVDGTFRLWAPTEGGWTRYNSGGGDYIASNFGVELDPLDYANVTAPRDAFMTLDEGDLRIFYSDQGGLYTTYWEPEVGDWYSGGIAVVTTPPTSGWNQWISGPSVLSIDDTLWAYYEGRDSEDGTSRIGRTAIQSENRPNGDALIEAPTGYSGVGQPWVMDDGVTGTVRMWMSLADGDQWSIGLAESADRGLTWSTPEVVLELDSDVAAPAITWLNGRYLLWASRDDGGFTTYVQAWSVDGRNWQNVHDIVTTEEPWDDAHPARPAVQIDGVGGWRLSGQDVGWVANLAYAGTDTYTNSSLGMSLRLTNSANVDVDLGDDDENGLEPGSFATLGAKTWLYATAYNTDLRPTIVALERDADGEFHVAATDLLPEGIGGNVQGVRAPVVVADGAGLVMYYAYGNADGIWRVGRATSSDGVSFTAVDTDVIPSITAWDSVEQLPHSVEALTDGTQRLWYTGSNGSRSRIGSAVSTGTTFSSESGPTEDWQLGTGSPGEFDDSSVRDPLIVQNGAQTEMWYAGNDGEIWRIGHAVRTSTGSWKRRNEDTSLGVIPVLSPFLRTFAAAGVYDPIAGPSDDPNGLWFAGTDGATARVGRAVVGNTVSETGLQPVLFPAPRFPSAGDTLQFSTHAGDVDGSVIELGQSVDGIRVSGQGVAGVALDSEHGQLYVVSKRINTAWIIDIRDDSTDTFVDKNYLDIEALFDLDTANITWPSSSAHPGPSGFRDVEIVGDRVYLTSWGPDVVWVLDRTAFVDDDRKQFVHATALGALPLADSVEDVASDSYTGSSLIGGADGTVSPDGRYLWVPQFRDNSVLVFDLLGGIVGEQIARIPYIGENPHMVRISPDGKYAVVANYTGEIDENASSGTLAVINADPTSPTFTQRITWIANTP